MKKTILTLAITLAALVVTCTAAFASQAVVDSNTYRHPAKFDNCMVIDGVDVSVWQETIDWEKVKRQGIDYAFIRIGYTGLDSPFSMKADRCFEQNYRAAKDAGVMVGVYYYSCAVNIKEAQKEAQYVLDLLNGRSLDLPVVFDYEFAGRIVSAYNSWSADTRRPNMTSNTLAFLNYIKENSDYDAMFYSYRNMLDDTFSSNYKFHTSKIDSKYKVWMAQYSTDNSYYRPFEFWQYSSSGKVTGITGNTDCNFWYYDNDAEVTKKGTTSIKDASVSLSQTSYEYTKFQKRPDVNVTYNGLPLVEGQDYNVHYIKNVLAGTGYAMVRGTGKYSNTKLVPFNIATTNIADGGTMKSIPDKTYTGSEIKPLVTVYYKNTVFKKDVDYKVSYSNNVNAGTAKVTITGMRNFHGSFSRTFKINKLNPTFTGYTSYTRTPSRNPWTINTKCNSGAKLTYKSSDTSIAKVDANGKVTLTGGLGVAYITVSAPATENYNAGSRQVKITVNPETLEVPFIAAGANSYSKKIGDKAFSLNAKTDSDGKMTFSSDNTAVATVDSSGTVKLAGKTGTAVITIKTAQTEKFASVQKQVTVTVTAANDTDRLAAGVENTTIDASSALGDESISVKWSKSPGFKMDYYEVFRSTSKSSGYGDTPYYKTSDGTQKSYKNTKGLTDGKTYYYKIRGVRTLDGNVYYSKWSNITSVQYHKPTPPEEEPNQRLIDGVQNTTLKASSESTPGYIRVKWTKSPGFKMDYYEIYRSEKSNVYKEEPIYTTKKGTTASYKNSKSLKKGTRYYYRVRGCRVLDGKTYYSQWSTQAYRVAK